METVRRKALYMICITLLLALTGTKTAAASMEEDEKECADQITELAACIPFVSGTVKQPTKECCDDTNKVRSAKPKCLCVLIKESSDPSIGLPINTTLALQMPAACKIDAKVSDCPSLLNIPADSPDAKIFKVADADSSTGSTATSPPSTSDSTASTKSPSTSSTASDNTKATSLSANNGDRSAMSTLLVTGLATISLIFV